MVPSLEVCVCGGVGRGGMKDMVPGLESGGGRRLHLHSTTAHLAVAHTHLCLWALLASTLSPAVTPGPWIQHRLMWPAVTACPLTQALPPTLAHTYCLQGTTRIRFRIATRGLLGLRNALLTATRGMGVMNTIFAEYGTNAGVIQVSIGSQALPT